MGAGWIGVDLDGTLAEYGTFQGVGHIGRPIPVMAERVKRWVNVEGLEVRIFTARASDPGASVIVAKWCLEHLGFLLKVTCVKDFEMRVLYDDRAVAVEKNTGRILGGEQHIGEQLQPGPADVDLAKAMYRAYNDQGPNPWKTFDGRSVPSWDEITDQVRGKWGAAAAFAKSQTDTDAKMVAKGWISPEGRGVLDVEIDKLSDQLSKERREHSLTKALLDTALAKLRLVADLVAGSVKR